MSKLDLGSSYDQFVFLQTFRNNPTNQSNSMSMMNEKTCSKTDSDTFDDLRMEEDEIVIDTTNQCLHRVKASTPLSTQDSDSQGYVTNGFSPHSIGTSINGNGYNTNGYDTNGNGNGMTQSVGMCNKCTEKEATMMNDCEHMLVCNKCAMKMATGGKCKVCKQFFGSFKALRRTCTQASGGMMDSDSD